jgi:hypothetical protein
MKNPSLAIKEKTGRKTALVILRVALLASFTISTAKLIRFIAKHTINHRRNVTMPTKMAIADIRRASTRFFVTYSNQGGFSDSGAQNQNEMNVTTAVVLR